MYENAQSVRKYLSSETQALLLSVSVDDSIIEGDVVGLLLGGSPKQLLSDCLDGSDGNDAEWKEYVSAVRIVASR